MQRTPTVTAPITTRPHGDTKVANSAAYSNTLNDVSRVMYDSLKSPNVKLDQIIALLTEIRDSLKDPEGHGNGS